ncbi:hypothetical protein N789_11855 [Arenimonas oryziterrae DSM 21050 = YC6267]|uniref:diguanylate cyclase n=1 Tax=Arenimonas oryziterrae DSM 21050 = YC6267 TaxID=1121015 RepID=A0A091ARJ5_9GAMM|nr:hypothetical protein N789_11855 [Arenimonas oryziterrae DSM 21050 = YC6267]
MDLRLTQEVADTRERIALGGLFYLAGWLLIAANAPVYVRNPLLGALIAAAFVVLAALRFLRTTPLPVPEKQQRWLDQRWLIVYLTAGLWGAVLGWTLAEASFAPARTAALLCTIAYATAMAHTFSMRRGRALAGIALIYLPALFWLWRDPEQRINATAMTVYLIYVVLALIGSHAEYQRRLGIDSELRLQRDRYEELSRTDGLTGLDNRRHFSHVLDRLCTPGEGEETLSLLLMDIDHFKRINDEYGHAVGDACLVRFAERMRQQFPDADRYLARVGGEEFAVLLPGRDGPRAFRAAEDFRKSLAEDPLTLREGRLRMSVSIGVASLDPARQTGGDGLYRAADGALYRAKSEGRDRVCREPV